MHHQVCQRQNGFSARGEPRYDRRVNNALNVIGAVSDVFTWLGALATGVFGVMLLVIVLQQKTWVPVKAMLETEGKATVARWFDDSSGSVGAAILTPHQAAEVSGTDSADVWVQPGQSGAVRMSEVAPSRKPVTLAFAGSVALLVVSLGTSIALMIIEG